MFYDRGHPTNIVIREIVSRLLDELGVDGIPGDAEEMNNHEEFVYPCVARALGLNWKQEEIRKGKNRRKVRKMDMIEWLEEYAWWREQSAEE